MGSSLDYCDLSDLPVSMCSHCKGLDERVTVHRGDSDHHILRRITAQYDGYCGDCGEWTIRKGDPLFLVADDINKSDGIWAGECCVGVRA